MSQERKPEKARERQKEKYKKKTQAEDMGETHKGQDVGKYIREGHHRKRGA